MQNWQCDICSKVAEGSFSHYIIDGKKICEKCLLKVTTTCTFCGNFHLTELFKKVAEINVCQKCFDKGNGIIRDYSHKPVPQFLSKCAVDLLYFGIELEVENAEEHSFGETIQALPDFIYVKHDSSLTHGMELVSHPMNYSFLQSKKEAWNNILRLLYKQGYRSAETDRCDIHIHLSKRAFGRLQLYKFANFIYENKKFCKAIGCKNSQNTNAYRYKILYNMLCEELVKRVKYGNDHDNRYTAVNFNNKNTVEIRIFKGTLNPSAFWRNIEFVKALFDYCNITSLDKISDVSFKNYITKKEFPNLYNHLHKNTISDKSRPDKNVEIVL